MSMKPRIEPLINKKIDPKLCTSPSPERGNEEYTRLEPFTVTGRVIKTNERLAPNLVTAPRKNA
jgi:hypothetical protein